MHGELRSLKSLVLDNTDWFQTVQPLYCLQLSNNVFCMRALYNAHS